jgi:dsRNA-specific ribonuclease
MHRRFVHFCASQHVFDITRDYKRIHTQQLARTQTTGVKPQLLSSYFHSSEAHRTLNTSPNARLQAATPGHTTQLQTMPTNWSLWAREPAKSRLAAFGQGRGKESSLEGAPEIVKQLRGRLSPPTYTHTRTGPPHDTWFVARCHIRSNVELEGGVKFDHTEAGVEGSRQRSLKNAEESAAQAVRDKLSTLLGCTTSPSQMPAPSPARRVPRSTDATGDVKSVSLLNEYAAVEFKPKVEFEQIEDKYENGQISWRARYTIGECVHEWGVGSDKTAAQLTAATIAEAGMKAQLSVHRRAGHDDMLPTQRLHEQCVRYFRPVPVYSESNSKSAAAGAAASPAFTVHFKVGDTCYASATEPNKAAARQSAARLALDSVPNQPLVAELRERRQAASRLPKLVSGHTESGARSLSRRIVEAIEKKVHVIWEATRLVGSSLPPPGAAVIAAIVQSSQGDQELEVVALGTGSKFVNLKFANCPEAPFDGSRIVDSHAEVLTCRAFRLYLANQLDIARGAKVSTNDQLSCFDATGKLREGVSFHLYITTAPCGDARRFSIQNTGNEETCEPNPKRSRHVKYERVPLHDPDTTSPEMGKRSTKIADGMAGSPTDSKGLDPSRRHAMSCSDKVLKWGVAGLQGRLLRTVLPQQVPLTSIVVGSDYDKRHIERALCCRLSDEDGSQCKLQIAHEPLPVTPTAVSKPGVGRYSTSMNWFEGSELGQVAEVTDGPSGQCTNKSWSRLCKAKMTTRLLGLEGMPVPLEGEWYVAFKKRVTPPASAVEVAKATMDIRGSSWVHSCERFDFKLSGVVGEQRPNWDWVC